MRMTQLNQLEAYKKDAWWNERKDQVAEFPCSNKRTVHLSRSRRKVAERSEVIKDARGLPVPFIISAFTLTWKACFFTFHEAIDSLFARWHCSLGTCLFVALFTRHPYTVSPIPIRIRIPISLSCEWRWHQVTSYNWQVTTHHSRANRSQVKIHSQICLVKSDWCYSVCMYKGNTKVHRARARVQVQVLLPVASS